MTIKRADMKWETLPDAWMYPLGAEYEVIMPPSAAPRKNAKGEYVAVVQAYRCVLDESGKKIWELIDD